MLDFTRLMLILTQVEVGVEVGVELDNSHSYFSSNIATIEKYFILDINDVFNKNPECGQKDQDKENIVWDQDQKKVSMD